MNDEKLPRTRSALVDFGLALFLTMGASPLFFLLAFGASFLGLQVIAGGVAMLAGTVALAYLFFKMRAGSRAPFVVAAEVLVLVVLPIWGAAYNHSVDANCKLRQCEVGSSEHRVLAEPEIAALFALHVLVALAYVASRRRPEKLHPSAELFVHALLVVGVLQQLLLGVQFGEWLLAGVIFPPLFFPCAMPIAATVLYVVELRARLRRRGAELVSPGEPSSPHWPTLLKSFALSPPVLGAYAVLSSVALGGADAGVRALTRTCGSTLSRLPIEIIPGDCHYLCTVAARGHTWLVRPERLGRRRGVVILVNRQLAVANAFEDLLHERWPRFGALARRIYDRLGLPVSRLLRGRLVADLVYLAMKPFEWLFYAALLLLDRGAVEGRIDRMYR